MIMICPITTNIKDFPTHYHLEDSKKINGSVLCEHIKSIDYDARKVKFVENEFCNNITDYDFEVKYLRLSYSEDIPCEFRKYRIYTVTDNIMNLSPGIVKGMWDRDAYKKIKKNNKEIILPRLEKVPLIVHYVRKIVYFVLRFVPTKYTKKIKRIINKMNIYQFASDE